MTFENYIATYGADVWRLCYKLCSSNQDSEDLYQRTWLRAYEKLDKFKVEQDFRKWIFAVCYNLYKNDMRYASTRPLSIEYNSNEEKDRAFSRIPSKGSDLDTFLDIKVAVNSLPATLKSIVVLYYFDDFKIKDIGKIMGLSVSGVKNKLHSARKLLKERLDYNGWIR